MAEIKWFTFYTNDEYKRLAEECVASFAKFGLTVEPVALEDKGDWMLNCMQRANHLLSVPGPVGWVDADAVCVADPKVMREFKVAFEPSFDVMVRDHGPTAADGHKFNGGLVASNDTPRGRGCLAEWARQCAADKRREQGCRDQFYLLVAVERISPGLFRLPPTYNAQPDAYGRYVQNVVVKHDWNAKKKAAPKAPQKPTKPETKE